VNNTYSTSNSLRMFSVTSQTSAFGFGPRSTVSSAQRRSTTGRQQGSISSGRRRPTLTLTDLEPAEPFENLKNIDKPPPKSISKNDDNTGSVQMTRVSFIGDNRDENRDEENRTTPEPLQALLEADAAVKRTTQNLMTSQVPRPPDVKPSTQETMSTGTTPKPMTPPVPRYTDNRCSTQEIMTQCGTTGAAPKPVTSPLPRYIDIKPSTQETVTLSQCGTTGPKLMTPPITRYTDVKPSTQETMTFQRLSTGSAPKPMTSPVPRYIDIKPSTQETMTLSQCGTTGAAQKPVTSPVPRYTDIKPSTQETVTTSQCVTTGATPAQSKETPCLGKYTTDKLTKLLQRDLFWSKLSCAYPGKF